MYKILSTLLLLSPFFLQAQQWINCTSGTHINDIVADNEVLWIATDGGLVKYNQTNEEKTFFNRSNANIPTDNIISLVLDDEGKIWTGAGSFYNCSAGIAYYDGEEWTRIDSICGVLTKDLNGDILVATSRKLYRFDGEIFTDVDLPLNTCTIPTGIAVSPVNGDIWMTYYAFGCYNIVKYDGESFEVFANQNSPVPFESPSNNSVYVDESGKVWLGTWSGVYVYDGTDWTAYTPENSNLPNGVVSAIKEDDEGVIWVGVENYYFEGTTIYGLAKFDGENWIAYELPTEYKYANVVNTILPVGNDIFVGSEDGFFKYDLTSFENIITSNSDLIANNVNSILHHGEDTWIGVGNNGAGYKNIVKITADNWTSYNHDNTPFAADKGSRIMDINEQGHVYVINGEQIYVYDGTTWGPYNIPDLVDDVVEANARIRFDSNNQPWLFNYLGYIFRYTGTVWETIEPATHGNVSGLYLGIDFNQNTNELWFGSYSGLYHFDGNDWTTYTDFGINTNNSINALKVDGTGNVWVAVSNGLAMFDGENFTSYNMETIGLEGNHTFRAIEIDEAGHIWAGTDNIVVEFDGENWEVYTTLNSGLPNGNINALAEDEHQNMWIGTTDGGFAIFNKNGIEGQDGHTLTNEITQTLPLNVYPNLLTNQNSLHIVLPNDNTTQSAKLVLTDTFGKQLLQSTISLSQQKYKLDISNLQLSSATYFITLITNEKRYVAKVVVLLKE